MVYGVETVGTEDIQYMKPSERMICVGVCECARFICNVMSPSFGGTLIQALITNENSTIESHYVIVI